VAYQPIRFYYYHAAREAIAITYNLTPVKTGNQQYDGRQGETFDWDALTFSAGVTTKRTHIQLEAAGTPGDDLDTLILSGHNINGNDVTLYTNPVTLDVDNWIRIAPDYTVTEANGVPIVLPLTTASGADRFATLTILQGSGANIVPEISELFLTKAHEMARGPEPGWEHSWRRTQRRFVNDAGVSSTMLLGAARKTWTFTFRGLEGADRTILQNMRTQTNDFSEPFWMRPPDTAYPHTYVELDRDSEWIQDQGNPLDQGTADTITLPMIEVLG
jgi:hypothetical protein